MAGKKLSEMKSFVDSYPHHRVHLGVDVHKLSYHVAVLRADGCTATMVLPADPMCVLKLIDNLGAPVAAVAYESGPTGFGLARTLQAAGHRVIVAAASRIPRKPAPGAKTDSLDCRMLASYSARGMLHSIAIPSEEQEAERMLIRRRDNLTKQLRTCKQRICSILLQLGVTEPVGLKNWSKRAITALEKVPLPLEARLTLDSLLIELRFLSSEREGIMRHIAKVKEKDHHKEIVENLCSVPGVGEVVAAAFRLEIFAPERFRNAEEVTSYLGLAPMARQSGQGNGSNHLQPVGQRMLRGLLVEAAWKFKTKDSRARMLYNRLILKHGVKQKAIVAVARKLAALLWRLCIENRGYEVGPA